MSEYYSNQKQKAIDPSILVPADLFTDKYNIKIDLVYAQAAHPHNIFGQIYRKDAQIWIHKDLACITLLASELLKQHDSDLYLEIKDCLRTTDAQAEMQESDIVKRNPHWCEEPRLLSPPGKGAHPRAMAIDVIIVRGDGTILDMGTNFDHLSEDPAHNPAARNYDQLSSDAKANRKLLENVMISAARKLNLDLLPLGSEWWDFRFPPSYTEQFMPLSDADLPPQMKMTDSSNKKIENSISDFSKVHCESLLREIENRIA